MKKTCHSFPIIALSTCLTLGVSAQTTLLDWGQNWNYLHPTDGALPAGSGATTPHPDGTTPWFAEAFPFAASYTGPSFTTSGANFDAGSGAGPFGYGTINYTSTPDPAPAEFTDVGTNLSSPASGDRFTAYFRTTFTVPNDGNFYINPTLRYILDDGGFVYLNGELILQINTNAADDYLTTASGTSNTESQIRTAELSLPVGSRTGANTVATTPFGNNATLLKSFPRLSPGTHTLAVSVHNSSSSSSDLAMAIQIQTEVVDCIITGSASSNTRDLEGTPANPTDDTISTNFTVASEGVVDTTWTITGPAGSSLVGQTGAYNTPVTIDNIPIADLASGVLTLEIADSTNAACTTTVDVLPQRIIGTNALPVTSLPIITSGNLDTPGWTYDDTVPNLVMNNPGGVEAVRYVVTSEDVDLTGQPDVQFTGTLTITDTSSGNEETDGFVAYLILDGDTANPVNLITRHDLITADGILTGDELASGQGTFVKTLNHVIPASVNSARLVIEGINNSASEVFTVAGLGITSAPPELQAYAGPIIFNNQGTENPGDDTYSSNVVITPVNLGLSTGWTSDKTPASGLYATPNPVTFGPFDQFITLTTANISDVLDPSKTVSLQIVRELPELTINGPTNIIRIENGPGFADDSLTFDLEITGTNGGPHWVTPPNIFSPITNSFGVTTFTIPAPLTAGTITFDLSDVSYPTITETVTLRISDRYRVGQSDLTGSLVDLTTDLTTSPSERWVNDSTARTLTLSTASTGLSVVESEVIDLSTMGEVYFTGLLRALDTSSTSNFETGDRFKAELVYNVAGVPTTINLITPYDTGDGGSSTTGTLMGANGPADGFINGYLGAAGTDLADGVTVYASVAEDYDAHVDRDEFNPLNLPASASLDVSFSLTAAIPADADDVKLVITGQGIGGSESVVLSNILFTTEDVTSDSDGDGLPNTYEVANGLNPNDPSDRDTDLDGDGQSNFSEFLAGTDPNDPTSFLRITAYTLGGGSGSISWSSVPGKSYIIEFSTDLMTWTNLGSSFAAEAAPATETSSGNFPLTAIGTPPKAFFRVAVAN